MKPLNCRSKSIGNSAWDARQTILQELITSINAEQSPLTRPEPFFKADAGLVGLG
jgi:hypothetical protein